MLKYVVMRLCKSVLRQNQKPMVISNGRGDIHARACAHTHKTRLWADNEKDLTTLWDVMFISLHLPPTIPPDHNSLCPDKPGEGERKTERPSEENGEVKKEGATHRPHNGCGISYMANTHTETEA